MHWCPMCDSPFGEGTNDCHVCINHTPDHSTADAREESIVEQAETVYQQMASVGVARINIASGEDVCLSTM